MKLFKNRHALTPKKTHQALTLQRSFLNTALFSPLLALFTVSMLSTAVFADYALVVTAPTTSSAPLNTALLPTGTVLPAMTDLLNVNHFDKIGDLKNMSRGFANAEAAASYAGSNLSFQNYDLISILGGVMVGGSIPSYSATDLSNQVDNKGDAYIGVAPAFALNIGLKVPFVADDLYLNGKVGYGKFNNTINGIDVEAKQFLLGVGLNYALIKDTTIIPLLLKWRGLSFGTGLTYINSQTDITVPFDGTYSVATGVTTNYLVVSDVKGKFNVKSQAFVVPVDIATSLQIVHMLNLGLGAGFDFQLPSSKITNGGSAAVNIQGPDAGLQTAPGSISIKQTTKSKATFTDYAKPKLMASVGLNITIVKIDVPVVFYPASKTFAAGICAGIVW
jgi:hypothetical protein